MKLLFWVSCLFAVLLPSGIDAAVIAENGQSSYDIVIRAKAPKTARYAADELKAYLKANGVTVR